MTTLPPPFAIDLTSPRAGSVHVQVRGDLDLATSPELCDALIHEISGGKSVVLDLSGVTFIDSTGLNTLIQALGACKSNGGALKLCPDLPAQVSRLFQISGLAALLPVASD